MCLKMAERVEEAQPVYVLSELMKLKEYMCHRMAERVDEAETVYVSQDD